LDWLIKFTIPGKSLALFFAGVNVVYFLYSNLRLSKYGKFEALTGVSYSNSDFRARNLLPLFNSLLGSRRIDDLAIETGILMTFGKMVEHRYGSPFFFKFFLGSFYIGFIASTFFVNYDFAKRSRYFVEDPKKRLAGESDGYQYRFQSAHSLASGLLYFYMIKRGMALLTIPVFVLDMIVWGPYYSPGFLTGLAFAVVV